MTNSHIIELYEHLRDEADTLIFSRPAAFVYNPLRYAWDGFSQYLAKFPAHARVVFVGMNPGPWGMAQTGVPFGEVESVRDFLGIRQILITPPEHIHPSYPVSGLDCTRSEVSGRRLWGLFRERFGTAENFFREHAVLNYCPLLFLSQSEDGRTRNLTPDKLTRDDREKLFGVCDACLRGVAESLSPEYVVGVGAFAEGRAVSALEGLSVKVVKILHPSPASPASNHDWAGRVSHQLAASGIWRP